MKVAVTSLEAEQVGEADLSEAVFGLSVRRDILHRMVVYQLARRRAGTHLAKTRGQVRGSTRKIVRQKGTGSARHGSRRVNIFRGGGVAHGPVLRSHAHKLPRKLRALAMRQALSAKAQGEELIVLDKAETAAPKTAQLRPRLEKLGLVPALIVDAAELDRNFALAARNIPGVLHLSLPALNVYDILRHRKLVLTRAALAGLEERFA